MSDPVYLRKTAAGALVAGDRYSASMLAKIAPESSVLAVIKKPRNIQHHRKFFALARFAFDRWNPDQRSIAGAPAAKSFERFRKDLVIQAGYYEIVLGLDGEPRLEAKSLAFESMGQDEFADVYESVVAVLAAGLMPGLTVEQAQKLSDAVFDEGF